MESIFNSGLFPKGLESIRHNEEAKKILKKLAKGTQLNLILSGPEGSGKYTLLLGYLSEIYGNKIYRKDNVKLKLNSNFEINVKSSNFHTEIDMAKYYNHDKIIVAEYFKQRIKSFSIEKYSDNDEIKNQRYHLIVLLGCDLLSLNAQYAMRRLMETYYKTTRFIFIVKNINKLVQPLQSRCINVNVKTPNNYEIQKILEQISIFKEINISPPKIENIVNCSNGNLKVAISSLFISETSKDIYIDPEINDINYICKKISSFKNELTIIYEIKDLIYSLLIKGINSNKIINILYNYFVDFFSINNKNKIIDLTEIFAYYDSRIVNHCKDVIHFEALVYNLFSLIHNNEYFIDDKC